MIKLTLQYEWQPKPGRALMLDATLFQVLHAIQETGSIAAATRQVHRSYRYVWGLTGKWEKLLGSPLVTLRKGRGAQLTDFGRKLLWAQELVQARLTPELESVRQEIERALSQGGKDAPARLSICASHDIALAQLRDRLAQRSGFKLDVRFQGSLASLAALARGQCGLAGFHIADGLELSAAAEFRRLLHGRRHRLIGLATRTQGLMLARGNPKRIASLADLARPGTRFVNRQQGSGSRIELDQLLSGAGIHPAAIDGYLNEEFTHLAVAATVAGGMADAGYGIEAAAAQYELDYIPLLTERYYLACRRETLSEAALIELVETLRGEEFREILAGSPGYGNAITGKIFEVDKALPRARAAARPARLRVGQGVRDVRQGSRV
jgi:putative molybdopterin biosynthesis protein